MKKLQKIINLQNKNILIYLGSDLLSKALPFLFIPIFTAYLTPEQYGNISLFNIAVEICVIVIIMGGNSYYKMEYLSFINPLTVLYNVIFNISYIFLLFLMIVLPLSICINSVFLIHILPVIGLCAYLQSVMYVFISYFQCKENAVLVGCINLIFSVLNSILMVYLLIDTDMRELARYWSYGLALFLSIVIIVFFLTKKNSQKLDWSINRSLLKFGLEVMPHSLSWWARSGMDRLLIGWFLNVSMVGIYSLAMQITSLLPLLCNAVNQAFIPTIVRELNSKSIKKVKNLLIRSTFFIVGVCILTALLVPYFLMYFIDGRYYEAIKYIPYMMAAFSFQACTVMYGNVLYFYKELKYLSTITFSTSIIHIFSVIFLLTYYPSLGIYGLIIVTNITVFIAAFFIVHKAMVLMKENDVSH